MSYTIANEAAVENFFRQAFVTDGEMPLVTSPDGQVVLRLEYIEDFGGIFMYRTYSGVKVESADEALKLAHGFVRRQAELANLPPDPDADIF